MFAFFCALDKFPVLTKNECFIQDSSILRFSKGVSICRKVIQRMNYYLTNDIACMNIGIDGLKEFKRRVTLILLAVESDLQKKNSIFIHNVDVDSTYKQRIRLLYELWIIDCIVSFYELVQFTLDCKDNNVFKNSHKVKHTDEFEFNLVYLKDNLLPFMGISDNLNNCIQNFSVLFARLRNKQKNYIYIKEVVNEIDYMLLFIPQLCRLIAAYAYTP